MLMVFVFAQQIQSEIPPVFANLAQTDHTFTFLSVLIVSLIVRNAQTPLAVFNASSFMRVMSVWTVNKEQSKFLNLA